MASSIKKNLGFQTFYQVLNTCMPLITAPYLARVLGAAQLGIFSYTSSVVGYFGLLAMLGTINYGTRSISTVKDDEIKRSRIFLEIYILQIIVSFVSILAYVIFLLTICQENNIIATIQIITLLGCLVDISWLFFGVEDFKVTVSTSMSFRIITFIAIFLLVKSSDDLWIYTILMLGGTLASQIVLWLYVPQYIKLVKVSFADVRHHLKPNIILFIPLLAMSVYHTMDKTMLGILSDYKQCGFYYNADKLVNIPLCILNGVGTVMLPRMTSLYNTDDQSKGNHVFLISLEGVTVVSMTMAFGIAAISKEFVPLFFGTGYEECVILTSVLAPVLVIKGFSNTIRTQYLVPLKKEHIFTKSVAAGAIVNLVANIVLIPCLGAMGAVIGTFLAELVSCIWQFVGVQESINVKDCLERCIGYYASGVIMFIVVRIVAMIQMPVLIKLLIETGIGGIVYLVLCFLFWRITKNEIYTLVYEEFFSKMSILRRYLK